MKLQNIGTVIIKELRNAFNTPTAYIVLVIFLFLWEFLFFRGAFLTGAASTRGLYDYLPWLLLFVVPALTMGSFSQEKDDGTLELLLTHPLKAIELLVGKFLAIMLIVTLALLFAIVVAWTFAQHGQLDWGVVWGQFLGSVGLVMVLSALGIFISSLFSSQISALLTTVFSSFFLIIAGFGLVTDRLTGIWVKVAEQLSVYTHYLSMIRGVIDTRDVIYFLSVSLIFLALAHLQLLKLKFGNQRKKYRDALSTVIITAGVVVLVNVVGANIPGRIDLTDNQLYTLSDSTKSILRELSEPVTITLYASQDLPAQVQASLREAQDVLRDYQTFGGGKVLFAFKDPTANEAIRDEAEERGVKGVQFNVVGQEEFQVKTGYFGVSVDYGKSDEEGKTEVQSIPFLQSTNDLEYQVTSFIVDLSTDERKTILVTDGQGEKSIDLDYVTLGKELKRQYAIKSHKFSEQEDDPFQTQGNVTLLNVGEEEEKIEDKETLEEEKETNEEAIEQADVLLVAGSNNPFTDETKDLVRGYIQGGGSVFFMADTVVQTPGIPGVELGFSPNKNSNKDLLEEFGITINTDLVYDLKNNEIIPYGNVYRPFPFAIRSYATKQGDINHGLESMTYPLVSSIAVDEDKLAEQGFEYAPLFVTSNAGGHQTEEFDVNPENALPRDDLKTYVLAASFVNRETGGRMVVIGDSELFMDQMVGPRSPNLVFALEALGWLAQSDSLASIRAKQVSVGSLRFESEDEIAKVKYGNIAFAVGVPLAIGAFRFYRRKKKRDLKLEV